MKEYIREYPLFSLCGLNCGLCPRYHTDGPSKCPGCGGPDFHVKHPSCAVITCNKKHDNVEYCFQCSSYPCEKYTRINDESALDSFISYRNVITDFENAQADLEKYKSELNEKEDILKFLVDNYNDGRRKSFYCNAINQLEITDLREIMDKLSKDVDKRSVNRDDALKDKVERAMSLIVNKAAEQKIDFKLRKQK